MESLSLLQKAWLLLSQMNGQEISQKTWDMSTEYSKKELKRKCIIVIDYVLMNCKAEYADYWIQVNFALNEI